MKALLTFVIGILIGATGMYYVFQNSLQENIETLLNTTIEAVQNNLSKQADKIDSNIIKTEGNKSVGTGGTSNLNIDKDVVNKLIESQKEEISKIFDEQKEKIKSQLEKSIKEYLSNKVSELFGK